MPEPTYDLKALKHGYPTAFEALVRAESPRLFRFLLRFLENEEDARNVAQETFLQAFR